MNGQNKLEEIPNGIVAFFDLLGFKQILTANGVEDCLKIVNGCFLRPLSENEKMFPPKIGIQTFVISDSILAVLPSLMDSHVFLFANFCSLLYFDLLINGLPARAGIATGKYYVQYKPHQIVLAGQPFVHAHELANSLEIAACAVAPSSANAIIKCCTTETFSNRNVPIKGGRLERLYLLQGKRLPREDIIRYFEAHKKDLGTDSGCKRKLDNTVKFLEESDDLKYL